MTSTTLRLFLAAILVSVLGACGEPQDASEATSEEAAPANAVDGGAAAADAIPETGSAWLDEQRRFLETFAAEDGVERSPGGVYYRVLTAGTGRMPKLGDIVRVHYEGRLVNGVVFDSSYERGAPAEFPSDRLIRGWQEILTMMHEGGKWQIAIPAELAYGARGAGDVIPPDSALLFTIELIEVKG
ncbi:MAG: FKBP-type peptidyl-prolyl cis-trans isomerase [Alphaproteobacteria bacterium]|nr:MAG: FKBP-type peptidyl-prolyl cis-trans isomerase [Alphaproteobacteria bacterium]